MSAGRHRPRLTARQRIAAALAALVVLVGVPLTATFAFQPTASAGTDDYPAQWKNHPMDTVFDSWREYNRECTSFVAFRLSARNGYTMPFYDNASNWRNRALALHIPVNTTPAVGAVAWSSGHVAWVESVGAGKVTIEEYNEYRNGTYSERTVPTSAYQYIHFKDLPQPAWSHPDAGTGRIPQPVFTVMNTSETPPDGVWFRDNPNLSGPRLNGYGVYMGDRVQLQCYGTGAPIGPYANHLWYRAANLTRPNAPGRANVGWLNAHYVNDGKATNVVDPGVPVC